MDMKIQEKKHVLFTSPDAAGLAAAVDVLRAGGLVAIPTETVYGLAADARDDRAVAAIYALKGRPEFNPLILHVADRAMAEEYAVFDDRARMVADAFWPGPLTLVLPLKPHQSLGEGRGSLVARDPRARPEGPGSAISSLATAGLDTVAIRVPAHKTARALLRLFDGPLAAPSANRSGSLSPTTPLHVADSFGNDAPMIVADGPCDVGLESTILDLSCDRPVILRAGSLTPDDFASVLGEVPQIYQIDVGPSGLARGSGKVKSPGQLLKHYAPRTRVRLRAVDVASDEAVLAFGSTRFMGVKGGGDLKSLPEGRVRNLSETGDLVEAAANLFRHLHELDASGAACIAVMDIPNVGLGLAINDRLRRAAAG
jgi:L-threonylcarbamoyladenylate synthase